MITLNQVTRTYPGGPTVLDRVDLHLNKGDFLYVVGGSGVGKTSLLRLLATEDRPDAGLVSLFGYSLDRISPSTLKAIRQALGYVPQDIRLIPDLTVFDNVALSLSLAGRRGMGTEATARVNEQLEALGLIEKKDQLCRLISGGEAQRVAVARALVRNPELIVADEPTGAQDRDFTWQIMQIFVNANMRGTTCILATHDQEIVRRVRKKCAVLQGGDVRLAEDVCIY